MKRYLILCVLLIFLIPCMVVPASASQWTSDDVEEIIGGVQTIGSDLYSWFEQWYAYFLEETEPVNTQSGTDILVTPFRRDLIDVQMYVWSWISGTFDSMNTTLTSIKSGLVNIYNRINTYWPQWDTDMYNFGVYLKSLKDNLDLLKNYFSVADETVYEYSYGYSNGEFVVNFEQVKVTSFVAGLKHLTDPIESALYALLRGSFAPSNKFDDDMTPIETEVDEWIDSMETAPTINVEDIETEVDKVTDFETDANYLSILSGIFLNEAFLMVFTWCVILAMLGFILYGKR